jgi:hypothetical protein
MEMKHKFTNDRQKYLLFAKVTVLFLVNITIYRQMNKQNNLHGLSLQANYTDRATASPRNVNAAAPVQELYCNNLYIHMYMHFSICNMFTRYKMYCSSSVVLGMQKRIQRNKLKDFPLINLGCSLVTVEQLNVFVEPQ